MQEEWRDVVDYEGLYQISNLGRVKVLEKYNVAFGRGRFKNVPEHIKTASLSKVGYYQIDLYKSGKRVRKYLHRLIAEAFIPNPDKLPCINHKDEDKTNNCIENLEWCTCQYNNTYGTNRERMVKTRRRNGTYVMSDEFRYKHTKEYQQMKKRGEI